VIRAAPDSHPATEPLLTNDFVPVAKELRAFIDFIKSLENTSLENGDPVALAIARLQDPSRVIEIPDCDELYSVKQFHAMQNATKQTNANVRENNHEHSPDSAMLS